MERKINFDDLDLPNWVMPMKTVAKQLEALGDTKLGREIMNDYQQFLLKVTEAFIVFEEDHENSQQGTVFDQSLGDSELTIDWLRKNMKKFAYNREIIEKIDCEVLSTDGFVSQIIRIRMRDTRQNYSNIIVKLPETRAIKSAMVKTVGTERAEKYLPMHTQEHFSRSLVSQFNRELDFYTLNDVEGLKLPEIFFSQKWEFNKYTGALVMEDLSHMAAVPFFESLNMQQIESLCSQLQTLHVHSQRAAPFWKKNFQYPETSLAVLCKLKGVVDVFVEKNEVLRSTYDKLEHLYENREFFEHIMLQSHLDIGTENVICHGDLWTYNFLWEADENGTPSDKLGAIIDWQNVHVGSIGEDLGRLLVFCCDASTRRTIERDYLPIYYAQLKQQIELRTGSWNVTWVQFLACYRACFVAHSLHLPFLANVMLSIKTTDQSTQSKRNQCLLERTQAAWTDALEILESDLSKWV